MYPLFRIQNWYNGQYWTIILSCILVSSCAYLEPMDDREMVLNDEDWELVDGPVQQLRDLTWDLHHQKLWVRFDFDQEQVIGRTEMLFTSEMEQSDLVFDAKTMEFDGIYKNSLDNPLTFHQDSAIVTVDLEHSYQTGDTLVLKIDFVSSPPQRGLYFVNPRGEDTVKPTQVWTLGQPEDNSFWFPTIDHPAERATQETWISVPPQYETLSNGLLKESRINEGDSLRTDYWSMSYPHTPYLFVLAAGEYEIVEEVRDDILYRYYVEPRYVEMVDKIYNNTADMIRFSEEKTGVPYPWDPVYAQAPVHDFIARGMENTTATLLYDVVQFDERAAQDLCFQDLIMHEIIHQWLGNLVTAKNWANLPLNEGFANYFESAYRLHNNGRDSYLWKIRDDRHAYFQEARIFRRPVIFDRYYEPEDMYDRHTYQKAGLILGMLQDYLGDDDWWEGVQLWTNRYAFSAVDIDDLQMVFEDVSGEDLEWFFTQWFKEPGHPFLDISRVISGNRAVLSVNQIQNTTHQPVFTLHPEILVIFEDGFEREQIVIEEIEEEYVFSYDDNILDIIVDPDRIQLVEYVIDVDDETLISRTDSDNVMVRSEALAMLGSVIPDNPEVKDLVIELAQNDEFWGIRFQAMLLLNDHMEYLMDSELQDIMTWATYENENHYRVRREALRLVQGLQLDQDDGSRFAKEHLEYMRADTSYFVTAEAIMLSAELFPDEASEFAGPFAGIDSYQDVIKEAVAEALILSDSEKSRDILMILASEPGDKSYSYTALSHLIDLIVDSEPDIREELLHLYSNRLEDPYRDYRMLAYQAMIELGAVDQIERLENLKTRDRYDSSEREVIQSTIRALEYERNYLD